MPDAIAIVGGGEPVRYRELGERATQLAVALRSRGVGPETIVALFLERSVEQAIGALAILLAGGAYLPIDPAYPQERSAFMIHDSQALLVISMSGLADQVAGLGIEVLCLDTWVPKPVEHQLQSIALEDNIAYVIYTSGSTGRPKGVAVSHRGLRNLIEWHTGSFNLTKQDRTSLIAGPAFDAAAWEMWPALAVGAALSVVDDDTRLDPAKLRNWLVRERISVSFVPTPLAEQLIQLSWPPETVLRVMLTGGDTLHGYPGAGIPFTLINNYGPTENTVVSTSGLVPSVAARQLPSIGVPIENTTAYVLDQHLQLVPDGEAGELFVGGLNLARGYHRQPALTAERFMPDPFSTGGRLYRTGDRVRYCDGALEFLGRTDHQIKLRGFRIELGEIEAALRDVPSVRSAITILRPDERGEPRLLAYVISDSASALLLAALQTRLPAYMLPAAIIPLTMFPLTANGKIDRTALPEPGLVEEPLTPADLPDGAIEPVLATIWADLLSRPHIRRGDNFFALGGHSLLATQLASRIRDHFAVELAPRTIFAAPTLAALATIIASAPPVTTPTLKLMRLIDDQPAPLSFAQQRLWFLDQFDPEGNTYTIPVAMHLLGLLDESALLDGLTSLIARHEALRTRFAIGVEKPFQEIVARLDLPLVRLDLANLPQDEREQAVHALIDTELNTRFDLVRGPLFRIRLARLAPDEHLLMLTLHHSITDGWSMDLLWHDLSAEYNARQQHRIAELPHLNVRYRDFSRWQREWMVGSERKRHLDYWRTQLAGASPAIILPTDRPRPVNWSGRGATQHFTLAPQLAVKAEALAHHEGATTFMVLLTAFLSVLAHWSQQRDLVVGTPIANRTRSEIERVVGLFVNTLVLRAKIDEATSFRDLLGQVRETALEAYAHQDLPFEMLVEELQPERDLGRHPIFQVMFVLQNGTLLNSLSLPGLTITPVATEARTVQFDLSLELESSQGGLDGRVEYATDIFDSTTIEHLIGHYQTLLAAALLHPETPITRLPLLTDAEQAAIAEWSGSASALPATPIHKLIALQAARTPEATAIVCGQRSLSYAELDRRSETLARYLRSQAIGGNATSEGLVGLALTRSPELIVALLGVLKAGLAYVPLDPGYPSERLRLMIEDSNLTLILTEESLRDVLPSGPSTLAIDSEWAKIEVAGSDLTESGSALPRVHPDQPAYIIYTSGSTGRPKGVVVTHRGLSCYIQAACQSYDISAHDRLLQVASISFDTSAEEIYPALLRGATLIFRDDEMLASPEGFLERCTTWGITVVNLPTAYWHELVGAADPAHHVWPSSARLVIIGGERALPQRVKRWQQWVGAEVRLVNTYGPTETTIVATSADLTTEDVVDGGEVPIGRPIQGAQVYLLDRHLQPVPVGVIGEIYIGGSGLARGYLGQPDLTAAAFVPSPFGLGDRIYRTGDLAQLRRDGAIKYLGRRDNQAKIRGFRVEPGEIEEALLRHPSIRAAAAMVREDVPDQRRLVAYIVAADARLEPPDLRRFLLDALPDYMVPATFIALNSLPLTPNGKLDLKALPAPARSAPGPASDVALSLTEQQMAQLWREILQVDQFDYQESFFALGGHSLLAIQLIVRVREQFQIALPIRTFFENPRLSDLARAVDSQRQVSIGPQPAAPTIVRRTRDRHQVHISSQGMLETTPKE